MSVYVTDTHPLIYYAGRNHIQLSDHARDAFEQAELRPGRNLLVKELR
jgi:hypothetical protein